MSNRPAMPETKVLAIASHVVYGYVGNSMATFCMQALGCEVSALHTVHFSNHTGYRQWTGSKATASEIRELYAGLQQSHLTDFDVLLSGYAPSAEVVEVIGSIAKELKEQRRRHGGSLFWVMDPVMGDNGRLYVSETVVPAYKALLPFADLILPNQFEAEVLSGVKITDLASLVTAISTLHTTYNIPHIIVTSVRFPFIEQSTTASSSGTTSKNTAPTLSIVGSTIQLSNPSSPRLFHITVPDLDAFFSGTGDMFAALMVARFRQICLEDELCATSSSSSNIATTTATTDIPTNHRPTWLCPDSVPPLETPLARAAELVCGSMSAVLGKTKASMDRDIQEVRSTELISSYNVDGNLEKDKYLRKTKAAEVRVVRFWDDLRNPVVVYKAEEVLL